MAFEAKKYSKKERPPAQARDLKKYPLTKGDIFHNFSYNEKKHEFAKCAISPEYFINEYVMVKHPKDGLVPFIMYDYQKYKLLPAFLNERFVITRKFRQGGFSTLSACFILWKILFQEDQEILVISISDREAKEYMEIIQRGYDHLPEFLQCELLTRNVHVFETEIGSKVSCYTPKAGSSWSCSVLVIDEAAKIEGMGKKWKDIWPTLNTGGSCWVISTCNGVKGVGEWYYRTWTEAENGKNSFFPVRVHYTEHPLYKDKEWVKEQKKNLDPLEFAQEVEGKFIGTADGVFDGEILAKLERKIINEFPPPIKISTCYFEKKKQDQKNLFVWEEPIDGIEYIMGVDISEGLGKNHSDPAAKKDRYDYSTIEIIRLDNVDQVLEYQNDGIQVLDFAKLVDSLARKYNNAWIVCEASALGLSVLNYLNIHLEYSKIYCTNEAKKLGLTINKNNRAVIITNAIDIISKEMAKIRSQNLINECRGLVMRYNGRIDHMSGCHDDLFFAIASAFYAREEILLNSTSNSNYKSIYTFERGDNSFSDKVSQERTSIVDSLMGEVDNVDLVPLNPLKTRPDDNILKQWGV